LTNLALAEKWQVTKFKCGGVALGVARHHRVADGEAASKFMEAWACACKGLPIAPILHDRGALMPNDPPMPMFPHEEYKKPPLKLEAAKPSLSQLVRKKLHFDLETLQRIKSSGVREGGFTTFESLTGHLWRCVTKARGLAGDVETRSLVAANGRRRLSPALPENYFGNVIFHANPKTTVRRLLEEPLSYAAGLVHASIRRLDNDYMRSAVDYVEQERRNPAPDVARSRSTVLSPNLSVTSWVQLPLYRLDFGWGTPLFAGPPFVPFEGLVILTPSHTQDGSIDALVALFADDMAKLESICFDTTLNQ
jgi:shikimate O-hydroxycinnamoyltransferase